MVRRHISKDRQEVIRSGLLSMRKKFMVLRRHTKRLVTDEELQSAEQEIEILRQELSGYFAELDGHGPTTLADHCRRLWNSVAVLRANVSDARWLRDRKPS